METSGGRVDLFLYEYRKIAWSDWVYTVYTWDELEAAVRFGWMYRG